MPGHRKLTGDEPPIPKPSLTWVGRGSKRTRGIILSVKKQPSLALEADTVFHLLQNLQLQRECHSLNIY